MHNQMNSTELNTNKGRNQGEGNTKAARRYNESAAEFTRSADVDSAARHAKHLVQSLPSPHMAAEKAARARAREEDPELYRPGWWTPDDVSAWDRCKAALRRDWEQTVHHLTNGHAGQDLKQTAGDTISQVAGTEPIPPKGEPSGVQVSGDWPIAMTALRFGFAAAHRYSDSNWGPATERMLAAEWHEQRDVLPWIDVRELVRYGWRYRRHGATKMHR